MGTYDSSSFVRCRAKRVTAPLPEVVRATLLSPGSSSPSDNSDGSIPIDDDYYLSFNHTGCDEKEDEEPDTIDEKITEEDDSLPFLRHQIQSMCIARDDFEARLLKDLEKALHNIRESDGIKRMKIIRNILALNGYTASICNTGWNKSSTCPPGSHAFIEVVEERTGERYVVELEFRAHFEMARASKEFKALVTEVPIVFVGRRDKLRCIIKLLCECAKRSLKRGKLSQPPWRKLSYVLSKWFGPRIHPQQEIPTSKPYVLQSEELFLNSSHRPHNKVFSALSQEQVVHCS